MSTKNQWWNRTVIADKQVLALAESDAQALRQKAHDVKGAVRTLELACELGAFNALGQEKSGALERAIRILAGEVRVLLEAYQSEIE